MLFTCSYFFLHTLRSGVRGTSCPSIASALMYLSVKHSRKGQSKPLPLLQRASRAPNKWLCAALAREREKERETGGWGDKNPGLCAFQEGDFKRIPGGGGKRALGKRARKMGGLFQVWHFVLVFWQCVLRDRRWGSNYGWVSSTGQSPRTKGDRKVLRWFGAT